MDWSEVEIHTINEAIEPVTNQLTEHGASGVSIEDAADFFKERTNQFGEIYELAREDYPEEGVIIKAYFLKTTAFLKMLPELENSIRNLATFDIPLGNLAFHVNDVSDEDWATAWKKYYHPVQVTDQITIVPSWEAYTKAQNEIIIELDPGLAFGTGTHPTTQLCIRELSERLEGGETVFDVGTGSGVLSIVSAKLGAERVLATDLDEVAVHAAKENIALNHADNIVTVRPNDLLKGVTEKADIIVANILAEVIVLFPEDVVKCLKKDGTFIASGIIKEKETLVKNALEQAGLEIISTKQQGDWIMVVSRTRGK